MKYRKKPIVIEAFKWTGGSDQSEDPEWIVDAIYKGDAYFDAGYIMLKTLEGVMRVSPGDYIIKGVSGEIYSCKHYIFEATYELEEK